jgi:hypothetical protein
MITLILLCRLVQRVHVIPPSIKSLKFGRFLGCGEIPLESRARIIISPLRKETELFVSVSGFLLLARVVAVTFCVTLAASLAARHGPTVMAGFQICCQLWLATSLLADGLAVAGQVRLHPFFLRLVGVVSFVHNQTVRHDSRTESCCRWLTAGGACKRVRQERQQEGRCRDISCVAGKLTM